LNFSETEKKRIKIQENDIENAYGIELEFYERVEIITRFL